MKKKNGRKIICFCVAAFVLCMCFCIFDMTVAAQPDGPLVIVIDPGHGGENEGAKYDGYMEKEMTMVVARAMKEELEKYDGVEVYLTRQGDEDMSIQDRAAFAGEKKADFLFCLHFNSSIHHSLFGTETWVPADGIYYAKGYSFAQIELKELIELGLYVRGIKTRLNDRGENYYGILRYCTYEEVPSVLIEHCHLDNEKDKKFYQQGRGQLEELGRLDATAAAKYFRLKSAILGVDYSDYPVPETNIPQNTVKPDKTEPDLCEIEIGPIDESTGQVNVHIEAEDKDSYILYYCYSTDGGNTYSSLEQWPRPEDWNQSSKSHDFQITVPLDEETELRAAVYNGFDLLTESNIITIEPVIDKELEVQKIAQEKALAALQKEMPEKVPRDVQAADGNDVNGEPSDENLPGEASGNNERENRDKESRIDAMLVYSVIAGIFICIILLSFFMAKMITLLAKGSKKQ